MSATRTEGQTGEPCTTNAAERAERKPFLRFTQVKVGGGENGPTPNAWRPWTGCEPGNDDREMLVRMAAHRFLKDYGYGPHCTEPLKFTIFDYDSATPLHPSGRPMRAMATEFIARPV